MDFSKAFDKVPHIRLNYKLDWYGIRGNTREWILYFLSGRSQRVVLEGASSDSEPVVSGVPQGTVLGPVLFLLYINDLPDVAVHSTARLFADDCIVYRLIKNNDYTILLQNDLNKIAEWEFMWQKQNTHTQKNIHKLDMIQRIAARNACNRWHNISSVTEMVSHLGWESLTTRRRNMRLCMM